MQQNFLKGVFFVFLMFFVPLLASLPANAGTEGFSGLDIYIQKAMQEWQVPGVAVALVKSDKVVFMKGYGVRETGKKGTVDVNTVFSIGSTSKAFTSAAVGLLVQDKKLSWDDRVIDHMRGFQLYDPWVTREIRVRDLLSNRSGLSGLTELLWYSTDHDRDEIVRRLRYFEPEASFRSQYAYRNCMFLTAGQLIPAVTGMSWDAFLQKRIFEPLGMSRSSTSIQALKKLDNVAAPHIKINGKVVSVPPRDINNIGPAGSVNASIKDMSQWLRFQIANGKLDGRQIAETAVIEETHKPHTPTPLDPEMKSVLPWAGRADYCLSWVMIDYEGDQVIFHNGQIDGIYAVIAFIPAKQMGAVILTNYENHKLSDVLFLRAIDTLLGRAPKDWNSPILANYRKQEKAMEEAIKELDASRIPNTKPSHPSGDYAGNYESDLYGKIRVSANGGKLVMHFSSKLIFDLEHWHHDTFRAVCRDKIAGQRMGPTFFTFGNNTMGAVSQVNMIDALIFKRLPN